MRSWWPTIAVPWPLCVQLPQVWSSPGGKARPSGVEPVRMSCRFGVSPRPLITSPFSLSAVCLLILLFPCSSSTSLAITTPVAFCHGPRPMRSRALTAGAPPEACVLRYARQVRWPAPAASASDWQCRSAPSRPPRSAPLPGPTLLMKKVMAVGCACTGTLRLRDTSTRDTTRGKRIVSCMSVLLLSIRFHTERETVDADPRVARPARRALYGIGGDHRLCIGGLLHDGRKTSLRHGSR